MCTDERFRTAFDAFLADNEKVSDLRVQLSNDLSPVPSSRLVTTLSTKANLRELSLGRLSLTERSLRPILSGDGNYCTLRSFTMDKIRVEGPWKTKRQLCLSNIQTLSLFQVKFESHDGFDGFLYELSSMPQLEALRLHVVPYTVTVAPNPFDRESV